MEKAQIFVFSILTLATIISANPVQAADVFSDNFNSGSLGWGKTESGAGTAVVEISNSFAKEGIGSLHINTSPGISNLAYAESPAINFNSLGAYNVSFYFMIPSSRISVSQNHWFTVFNNGFVRLVWDNGGGPSVQKVVCDGSGGGGIFTIASPALNGNIWYKFKIEVHPEISKYYVFVDGNSQATCEKFSNHRSNILVGDEWDGSTDFGEAYWDLFEIVYEAPIPTTTTTSSTTTSTTTTLPSTTTTLSSTTTTIQPTTTTISPSNTTTPPSAPSAPSAPSGGGGGSSGAIFIPLKEDFIFVNPPERISSAVSQSAEFEITISNTGNKKIPIKFDFSGAPAEWFSVFPENQNVSTGESITYKIKILPELAGNYDVNISVGGIEEKKFLSLSLLVEAPKPTTTTTTIPRTTTTTIPAGGITGAILFATSNPLVSGGVVLIVAIIGSVLWSMKKPSLQLAKTEEGKIAEEQEAEENSKENKGNENAG